MKKNRKKYSLNELAALAENIETQDQQATVGGIQLFSQNGEYLGKVGLSNDMRIVSPGMNWSGQDETSLYNTTTPYSSSQASVKEKVICTIARQAGVETQIRFVSGKDYIARSYLGESYIAVNESKLKFSTDNYYDIFLSLDHEQTHFANYYQYPGINLQNDQVKRREEIYTLRHTIHHDFFCCASERFRTIIEDYLIEMQSSLPDQPPIIYY